MQRGSSDEEEMSMWRPSRCLVGVLGWIVPVVFGADPSLGNPGVPIELPSLTVEPVVNERVRIETAHGTFVAGHFGGQMDACGIGAQAFIEKVGAWQRCQQSPRGGTCAAEGGAPLFAGLSCLDPAYLKASTVHDVFVEPTGEVLLAGEHHLAWKDAMTGLPVTSRGAFLLRLAVDGTPAGGACIGTQPDGPPTDGGCCGAFCNIDGGGGGGGSTGACGARSIIATDGDVVAAGWCDSEPGLLPVNKNYFVTRYHGDLTAQQWIQIGECTANEVALAVAADDDGDIWVTGRGGPSGRDLFVGKYGAGGSPKGYEAGGGPLLDEGREIGFDDQGRAVVEGIIHEEATYGGVVMGEPGAGEQTFSITLDSQDLQVLVFEMNPQQPMAVPIGLGGPSRWLPGKAAMAPHGVPLPPGLPTQPPVPPLPEPSLTLVDVYPDIGTINGGSLESLLDSDNEYLVFLEGEDPLNEGDLLIRFLVELDPSEAPFQINKFSMEFKADQCYLATVEMQPLAGGEFLFVGQREVCAAEEPVLSAEIEAALSDDLGFDGITIPEPDQRLVVRVTIDYGHSLSCPCTCVNPCTCDCYCGSSLEDGSVDDFEVEY
ncbi:MAG: hypothetical protein AAF657_35450, partial [Acidobacteriota bacterium]